MKKIITILKKAYTDKDGELSLISVMVTILFVLFLAIFIKAEFMGLAFSTSILEAIVSLIQIALGAVGAGYVGQRVMPAIRDVINERRAKPETNATAKDLSEDPSGPALPGSKPPAKAEAAKHHPFNSLATWAKSNIGIKETPGSEHNPIIMGWIKTMGWNRKFPTFNSDESLWCSLFPNVGAKINGLEYSDSPAAKSWMTVGEPIEYGEEVPQDSGVVAVYHRGYVSTNPLVGSGHVQIVTHWGTDGHTFGAAGGNQTNQTSETLESIKDPMFIGFRLIKPKSI